MENPTPSATTIRAQRSSPPLASKPNLFSPRRPARLTFAPLPWLKLRLFLHSDDCEIGGFAISSAQNLLYLEDFVSVKQTVSLVTVDLDDAAVADHFDRCVDQGISPARCGRIWLHTHPGSSVSPSHTDETTFERVFGACDWAVMAIVARGGESYARLRFNTGPGGEVLLPVAVDWERFPMDLSLREGTLDELFSGWMDEYGENIHHRPAAIPLPGRFDRRFLEDPLAGLDELYDSQWLEDGGPTLEEEVSLWH
jgi:hypothetical protein